MSSKALATSLIRGARALHQSSKLCNTVIRQHHAVKMMIPASLQSPAITQPSTTIQKNNTQQMVVGNRSYSTTRITQQSASQELTDMLNRELDDELAESGSDNEDVSMPDELAELKDVISNDWTILDSNTQSPFFASKASSFVETATIRMVKKGGIGSDNTGKVVVTFHCQDTIESEPIYEGDVPLEEEGGEMEEQSPPFKFHVQIEKRGMRTILSCVSQNGVATVQAIVLGLDKEEDGTQSSSSGGGGGAAAAGDTLTPMEIRSIPEFMNGYHGPVLTELPPDVLEALNAYLHDDLGVSDDVATFIAMYADYTEQKCYVAWLRGMKELIR